jgi:hypothetical protein
MNPPPQEKNAFNKKEKSALTECTNIFGIEHSKKTLLGLGSTLAVKTWSRHPN